MRLAVLIIGLCLALSLGNSAYKVVALGSVLKVQNMSFAGSIGMLAALLFVLGSAFVMKLPRVSTVIFAVAGVLGMLSSFIFYGVLALILAVMSWFGSQELRKKTAIQNGAAGNRMLQ